MIIYLDTLFSTECQHFWKTGGTTASVLIGSIFEANEAS